MTLKCVRKEEVIGPSHVGGAVTIYEFEGYKKYGGEARGTSWKLKIVVSGVGDAAFEAGVDYSPEDIALVERALRV